uniref:RING-type E3 ubiquitin transferase n=1 Tax=Caenorhabditis japonica TaxID=281687 RepID=A0A8R1HTV5_CAEJA
MAEPASKESKNEVVWLYGVTKNKSRKFYEFHKKLQEFIEEAHANGKSSCKVYIFGLIWLLDFKKMTKYRENLKGQKFKSKIRRTTRAQIKRHSVVGISGIPYDTPGPVGFQQTDDTCSVCFYKHTMPTRIDTCGHVFCFMCLKNNYTMGMECPTCRSRISPNVFENTISNDMDIHMECPEEYISDCADMFDMVPGEKGKPRRLGPPRRSVRSTRLKHYWIYESSPSGWYRYDPKNERYIEEAYQRKKRSCTLFISGYKMTIDLDGKTQERESNGVTHVRNIKRILSTELEKHHVKGIAGIRGHVAGIVE